ncbi:MAG: hypothetical protein EBS84_20790 [Proteobacteria bacterium]|nr:hypothetical protein [Pseudomonadota bacterium]
MRRYRQAIRLVSLALLVFASLWLIKRLTTVVADHPAALAQIIAYAPSNAPVTKLKGESVAFKDVTNATVKALIDVSTQLLAANRPKDTRKYYTATEPLPGQVNPLQKLLADSGGTLQAYLRPESRVPIQLKGWPLAEPDRNLLVQPNGKELAAIDFLTQYREVFLLTAPKDELRLTHQETDSLGRTVLRFAQYHQGIEVWPGELSAHFDPTGAIDLVHTTMVPTPDGIAVEPAITANDAISRAQTSVPNGNSGTPSTPELLIYAPLSKPPKLAWKTELSTDLAHRWQIVVDARTGELLKTANMCLCANVAGSGVDLLGNTVPLNVDQRASTYYLRDESKAMFDPASTNGFILVTDAQDATQAQLFQGNAPLYYITSSFASLWTVPDGVSAAYNFSQVYDYYAERHGRNSYNNKGSNLVATVRVGNLANAFWRNDFKQMFFGDVDRYAASLDVIGHELTHGVTYSIGSKGILDYHDESGALNESFSDIFGEMVEARANGGSPDWVMGSRLIHPVRNISNPAAMNFAPGRPYPQRMSEFIQPTDPILAGSPPKDNAGVHENSSIFNRAYYLIAAGLTNSLGITNAEKVFYHCLTTKLLPQSQFIDARLGAVSAAEELFGVGSAQALKVAEGFDAIELFATPIHVTQSPTNLPAVNAPDSTIWVYYDSSVFGYSLARYEAGLSDPINGIQIATGVKITRPSVVGGGSLVAYVTSGNALAYVNTTGGTQNVSAAGIVSSLAFSPLADRAAFALLNNGVATNQILLLDLVNNTNITVTLTTPVVDSTPTANVIAAGAMSFSPDGRTLAYTAQSVAVDADGNSFTAWSIYTLDVATLEMKPLIPPNAQYQSLQPFFSRTSSRYLLFEVLIAGNSYIFVSDLETGTNGLITSTTGRVARACFTGDDSAVVFSDYDVTATSGASLYYLALSSDKLAASGSRSLWRFDSPVGVTYRRGTYTASNAPPVITITAPPDGTVYTSPAAFTIGFSASDPDGQVSKVELYDGKNLVASSTSPPFNGFAATNFVAGVHRYRVRAYDANGAATTSAAIRIGIRPNQGAGGFQSTGHRHFELNLGTTTNGAYRLEASTNLLNWISLGSYESVSGSLFYSDSDATNHFHRFYRATKLP